MLPTFQIPNTVRQYAKDILAKYPVISITQLEKFIKNKFQLELDDTQIRAAAYRLLLEQNGEKIMNNSYYGKLCEERRNTNTFVREKTPEDDMKRLQALEPLVRSLKQRGLSPKEVAIELEKKTRPIIAQQAVQAFYDNY